MCGIVGVFSFAANPERQLDECVRMRDAIKHRGPDDAGVWRSPDGRVVFGHRRLSIVDLSPAGHQPMANETESIWVTFNGEIYNHADYREGLLAKGHTFRSHCDTEAILHLYEEHGSDVVHQLDGMFAFGVWDGPRERLLLVRDRLGKKPLYYRVANGRLIFASEIKALLAHAETPRDLDREALDLYLAFSAVPPPHSLFKGIRRLPAGHRLVCDKEGNVAIERYWSPLGDKPWPAPGAISEAEAIEGVRDRLLAAVKKRLMADVPVGAFLSGGVDSSANVALMSRLVTTPIQTYSLGFEGFGPEQNFHDLPYAREVAQLFKCDHHEVTVTAADCERILPELVVEQDEPIGDPACLPMHFLSERVRKDGVIVALVGEGSDEVFGGYPDMASLIARASKRWALINRLPWAAKAGVHALSRLLNQPPGRTDVLRRARDGEPLYCGLDVVFWETEKDDLLASDIRGATRGTTAAFLRGVYDDLARRQPAADDLQTMSAVELAERPPRAAAHAGRQDLDGALDRGARAVPRRRPRRVRAVAAAGLQDPRHDRKGRAQEGPRGHPPRERALPEEAGLPRAAARVAARPARGLGAPAGARQPHHAPRDLQPRDHRRHVAAASVGRRRPQLRSVVPHQPGRVVRALDSSPDVRNRSRLWVTLALAVGFVPAAGGGAFAAEIVAAVDTDLGLGITDNASASVPEFAHRDELATAVAGAAVRYRGTRAQHSLGYNLTGRWYFEGYGPSGLTHSAIWQTTATLTQKLMLDVGASAGYSRTGAFESVDVRYVTATVKPIGDVRYVTYAANEALTYSPNPRRTFSQSFGAQQTHVVAQAPMQEIPDSTLIGGTVRFAQDLARDQLNADVMVSRLTTIYASGSGNLQWLLVQALAGWKRDLSLRWSLEGRGGALGVFLLDGVRGVVAPAWQVNASYKNELWFATLSVMQAPVPNPFGGYATINDAVTLRAALPLTRSELYFLTGYGDLRAGAHRDGGRDAARVRYVHPRGDAHSAQPAAPLPRIARLRLQRVRVPRLGRAHAPATSHDQRRRHFHLRQGAALAVPRPPLSS
jgi:asparagine synthase (glutamine-hydrolysing)